MANRNPKRIKLETSLQRMRKVDLIKELQDLRKENELMTISSEQLKAEFKRDLDVVNKQKQELTTERDSLLEQLQQEMSISEALRQKLLEHEQSHQSIVDSVKDENTNRVQEMSQQIEELTNQCSVYRHENDDLNEQLDQIDDLPEAQPVQLEQQSNYSSRI